VSSGTEHLLRELAPQVLGVIIRRFRDFTAAEDAVQEALIAASSQWQVEGVPENPRAWLIHVALRRMTDHVRGESARRRRETAVAASVILEATAIWRLERLKRSRTTPSSCSSCVVIPLLLRHRPLRLRCARWAD
jgi:predicted RNA polymerase sigma factor